MGMTQHSVSLDDWTNAVTGIGFGKGASTRFTPAAPPTDDLLAALPEGDWLASRIVWMPVRTAMRKGWTTDDPRSDELQAAWRSINYARRDEGEFECAAAYDRQYGGAILICGNGTGDMRLESPLKGPVTWIEAVARTQIKELKKEDLFQDLADPLTYGRPKRYGLRPVCRLGEQYVDASRVILFTGVSVSPRKEKTSRYGKDDPWGLSVLEPCLQVMADYGIAWASISHMLQESSIGIMKIKGLIKSLAQKNESTMQERAALLNATISLARVMMLDVEHGEDFTRSQVSFADIPQLLQQISQRLSGAAGIPVSQLLGQQPSGMNASTESENDQWLDQNDAWRQQKLHSRLQMLISGIAAAPVVVEFGSLEETDPSEKEALRKERTATNRVLWECGVITLQEWRSASLADGTLDVGDVPDLIPEETPPDTTLPTGAPPLPGTPAPTPEPAT